MRTARGSAQFGIDLEYGVGRATLSVSGELDALGVPILAGVLNTLVDRRTRVLTIDLTDLRFCSLSGLRALADSAARLQAVEGCVVLRSPSILTRLLDPTALQSLFTLDGSPTSDSSHTQLSSARRPTPTRPRESSLHRLSTA